MTKREAAIIEVYTGFCMLTGDDRKYVYEYASLLLGRDILTHEFIFKAEELQQKSKDDFIELCRSLKDSEFFQLVEHSKWIKTAKTDSCKCWICSKCKCLIETAHYCFNCYYDYCPYCGAKMDKE